MSVVEFLSQPLWQRLGLTLVHFLWQGLAVAVLAGAFVRVFRLKHGNARYGAYLLAFIAMIVCPVVTFTVIDIPISPNAELVTGAESTEVVDMVSYTALSAGDILAEAETSSPALPTLTDSIPLGERISGWLHISMPWILVIWMVGVVVLSVRLLMGFVGVYRWRHHLQPLPERLAQRVASLSERLGMQGFSRVFISPSILQAMAVGYLRPMVLLPAAMVTRMQPEMLEAIIAHELAHIRRFDLWINLAQRVTETLLFYHPAVWWLSICLRSERELCCDELAVKATGERITYASTLESVGRARFIAKPPILAAGLGQDDKPTLSRVRHILGLTPTQRNSPFWLAGVITVLFLAALVIPTTLALTNQSDEKLMDLERVVVEGIRANRDKFECGILAWSSKRINTRYEGPRGNLSGQHELWWDGKKMTTKYLREQFYTGPEGDGVEKQQGGDSYDGGVLSRKPRFGGDENWLSLTHWRGDGSLDRGILYLNNMEHIAKDWSVVDTNGVKLIRFKVRNTNETARDYRAYSIRDYDPSKGYGQVNEEWYNPDGSPRKKRTVKLQEVIPDGWFPVEVDSKSFAITDGRLMNHNHYALDIERCSFNDKSVLPKGIFKLGMEKQLKYQEKKQRYLAMELRGLSKVKEAAKGDKVKLGAREAIEKFIAAAMAGDLEKAGKYAHPDKLPANQIADITEIAKGQNLWIMAIVADDSSAIAVSSVIRGDRGRTGPLVFSLDRVALDGRDNWWVHDIDMETPDGAEGELKQFLEKHPKAQKVPYEKKTAVQVEGEEGWGEAVEVWKIFMGGDLERRIQDKEKMDPKSLITVRTVDHEGNPIPYCRVTFVDRDEKTTRGFHEAATDDKGYTYCDKIGGTFSITAGAFGYVPETKVYRYQHKKMAKLYNAQDKSVITIRWGPFPTGKGKIKGKVRDQHGRALKKFKLQINQRKGRRDDWSESYETMECIKVEDPQGHFELTGLAPGKYTYMVRAEDYSAYVWDFNMGQFTIQEELNATVEHDIEVEAKELLYGRAIYQDGAPLYKGGYTLWFERDPTSAWGGRSFSLGIEPNGFFRIGLSRQERKDLFKCTSGYIDISDTSGRIGQIHIDKLSKNPDNAPTFTFSRKMRKESLENNPAVQVEVESKQATSKPVVMAHTGRPLDIAIDGHGYFKVISSGGNEYYTRHGGFGLSPYGQIILMKPYGLMLEPAVIVPTLYEKIDISSDGTVTVTVGGGSSSDISQIPLYRFMNPEKLNYIGRNLFSQTDASGSENQGQPGDDGFGRLVQGFLEHGIKDTFKNTGRTLDVVILGRGLFGLDFGDDKVAFTRYGKFHVNQNGEVVWASPNGPALMPPLTLPEGYDNVSISYDGVVSVDIGGQTGDIGRILLYGVSYKDALRYDGNHLFHTTEASGDIFTTNEPGSNYFGILQSGFLESSSTTSLEPNFKTAVQVERESEVSKLLASLEDEKYAHTRSGIIPLVEENGQELLDKLRSYDSTFLNSQTISMEMEKPVNWNRPDERQKIKIALTTDNGSIGWEEEISYLSGPRYREGLNGIDRILYVWNVTRKQGLIENDFQARRREMVLLLVSPWGDFAEKEAGPVVEFRQSSDRKKFIEYTSVIWSTGRGFADHLKKIIEAKKDENGLIHFTAHGNFSPNSDGLSDGLWEMVVDPKSGYLVRSASFTGNGHESPVFICTTIGTKWFDNCSLAKEARFSTWDKSKITTTQTVQFKLEPDAKLFDKLRKTLRSELPKDTRVEDCR